MPKVPYDGTPNVQLQAPTGVMESAGNAVQLAGYAGQQAQELGKALGYGQTIVNRYKEEAEQADLKTRAAAATRSINELLHAPGSGYTNQVGKAAVDGFADTRDRVDQIVASWADGISDEKQRRQFTDAMAAQANAALTQINTHAAKQTRVYGLNASRERADASSNAAVSSYNPMPGADNSLFVSNMRALRSELEYQAVNGHGFAVGSPEAEQFIKQGLGKTKAGLVQHLVANDQVKQAEEVLKSMRSQGELDPKTGDELQKLINAGSVKNDALKLALDTRDAHPGDLKAQQDHLDKKLRDGSLGEGEKAADKYKFALIHLREDATQAEHLRVQQNNKDLGWLLVQKQQNPGMGMANLPAWVIAKSKTDFSFGKAVEGIFDLKDGPDPDTPERRLFLTNFYRHFGDGSDQDGSKLSTEDLLKSAPIVGKRTFEHVILPMVSSAQRASAKGADRAEASLGVVNMPAINSSLDNLLPAQWAKPKSGAAGAADREQRGAITDFVVRDILNAQQASGKKFTQDDIEAHIKKSLLRQAQVSSWRDMVPGVAPAQKSMLTVTADTMPSAARNGIVKGLRAAGISNPSNQQIIAEYWKQQNGQ